jgi:hypothetical protein
MRSPSRPVILPQRGRDQQNDLPVGRPGTGGSTGCLLVWPCGRGGEGADGATAIVSSAATVRPACPVACAPMSGSVLSEKGDL